MSTSQILALAGTLGVTERDLTQGLRRGVVSEAEIANTARLLAAAWQGNDRVRFAVNEAITTSDLFRSATGDVLDREMLAQYAQMPRQWDKFSTRTTVNDFRPKKLIDLAGARTVLPRVPEHSNYPEAGYSLTERDIGVQKTGEQFGYSFESRVNDQLNELRAVPDSWAGKAVATEDFASLESLANPLTGAPNTVIFNAGNGNLGSVALSEAALEAAVVHVTTQTDKDGNLLYPGALQLVVGPAQQFAARRILNAVEVRHTEGTSTTVGPSPFTGIKLTVLDNLPGTAWFVLPLPSAPRPAFYTAFLVGYEQPDIRVKSDQGKSVGGGDIGIDSGSFDDDTCYWRVRHIVGSAPGDPKFAYASQPG